MGLSIHYSGRLNDAGLIPQLIEEVQDVCSILQWPCRIEASEGFSGIDFTPPECETVSLIFLPNGELINKMYLRYDIQPANTISVKTQYAGIEVHIAVIKLLKHLSGQYFSAFELSDEGGYWETGDEEVLRKKFGQYDFLLNAVQTAMEDFKGSPTDTLETFAQRLETFFKARLTKKED